MIIIIVKYNSPETQNGILEIIGLQAFREIARNIQNSVIYTIMPEDIY